MLFFCAKFIKIINLKMPFSPYFIEGRIIMHNLYTFFCIFIKNILNIYAKSLA